MNLLTAIEFRTLCIEQDPEAGIVSVDDFDDCCYGLAEFIDGQRLIYSKDAVIAKLMDRDGMTYEEAKEFFYYNIIGAYVGDNMPGYLENDDEGTELLNEQLGK
jgi:hypothetical protein